MPTEAEKLAFDKPPGFYWLKVGGIWEVVRVSRERRDSDYNTGCMYDSMVSMLGKETKWSIYYFAEREWGPRISGRLP